MTLFGDEDPTLRTQERTRIAPPRRVIIGWVAIGLAVVLGLVLALVPAPFVIEQPGPVYNTLGTDQQVGATEGGDAKELISISGQKTYPTSGSLDLLTVSVVGNPEQRPSWMEIAGAWFQPSKAVLPLESVFPPGTTTEQSNAENAALMVDSQQDAIAAALNELGYTFPENVAVKQLIKGTPAADVLKVGDEITSVNGTKIASVDELRSAVKENGTGKAAELGIVRDGAPTTVSITPTESHGQVVLGIGAGMDYTFPFDVKIQLNDVGGPSAGQMFALGIIDKLTPGSLNGGKRIAGTGTIDNTGQIGPIGGIRQKMYAARDDGKADYFLAPASNCDEVTGHIPAGLRVFAVKTLDDSLKVLKAVEDGSSTSGLATCPAR
ncbi:PDZ domain-containing protein [Leifsonia sp. 98AMF]|uniref:YlbL family protein n=1 Tax=unclassified Leifsonia TaxID=2663824 RepID=UPI000879FC9D|nr:MULTISPECIES: PDZ domain-containing protein [unclassified Leifsonia]SDH27359.1 PDZ domain-containing protein [Leifsonia sp. 197AMF]SDJ11241.1 PDZ domain-containing protein [Leifsonia sp. 466MF]SDJ58820.1 PDZ domain-containing protein [Leifsonia sp. 157MF]SDN32555.1 PDZ domain-containing protein [Leifsonia sp. 509MF]SEM88929.1 PDZ domain-containing protein [Leifsonia sp. 467MF]